MRAEFFHIGKHFKKKKISVILIENVVTYRWAVYAQRTKLIDSQYTYVTVDRAVKLHIRASQKSDFHRLKQIKAPNFIKVQGNAT